MSPDLNVHEKQEVAAGAAESTNDKPIFVPVVDIWETDTGLMLVTDMPGTSPDSISVDLSGGTLTISGQVELPPQEGRKMLMKEYEVGNFYRQFSLADNIDQDNIAASMKDGVLKLELSRITPAQPRKIKVQIAED